MRNREPSVIQPDVTAKSIEEFRQSLAKTSVLALDLIDGRCRPWAIVTFRPASQRSACDHDCPGQHMRFRPRSCSSRYEGIWEVRPSVGEIAHEDHLPPLRRDDSASDHAVIGPFNAIAEFGEKSLELICTAMNVANDIERAVVVALVRPRG